MAVPLAYHELHRAGPRGWWRPVLGVVLVVVGTFAVAPVVWLLGFGLWFAVTGQDVRAGIESLSDVGDPTPALLAYLNLSLATAIAVVALAAFVLHRMPLRWVTSVGPRMRWRWFAVCTWYAVVALAATLVVTALLPAQGDTSQVQTTVNEFTPVVRDFLLVVVLLTPLQAAGEEYLFRGYLTQACGGLFGSRAVAVLVPALLFGLAHGAQDLPVFMDRFGFGVVAGVLVIATGGLEAAIAMHVLNNFLAFGLALAFTDMASALNPTGGSWWSLPATLTQSLVFLGLCVRGARRRGLETHLRPAPRLEGGAAPV